MDFGRNIFHFIQQRNKFNTRELISKIIEKWILPFTHRVRSISKARYVVFTYSRRGTKWAFAIICRPGKFFLEANCSQIQSLRLGFDWGLLPKNKNFNFPGLQMPTVPLRCFQFTVIWKHIFIWTTKLWNVRTFFDLNASSKALSFYSVEFSYKDSNEAPSKIF